MHIFITCKQSCLYEYLFFCFYGGKLIRYCFFHKLRTFVKNKDVVIFDFGFSFTSQQITLPYIRCFEKTRLFIANELAHSCIAFGALTFHHSPSIFRRYLLRVFHYAFGFTLYTIGFHEFNCYTVFVEINLFIVDFLG